MTESKPEDHLCRLRTIRRNNSKPAEKSTISRLSLFAIKQMIQEGCEPVYVDTCNSILTQAKLKTLVLNWSIPSFKVISYTIPIWKGAPTNSGILLETACSNKLKEAFENKVGPRFVIEHMICFWSKIRQGPI